jgi:hypothetical protein
MPRLSRFRRAPAGRGATRRTRILAGSLLEQLNRDREKFSSDRNELACPPHRGFEFGSQPLRVPQPLRLGAHLRNLPRGATPLSR